MGFTNQLITGGHHPVCYLLWKNIAFLWTMKDMVFLGTTYGIFFGEHMTVLLWNEYWLWRYGWSWHVSMHGACSSKTIFCVSEDVHTIPDRYHHFSWSIPKMSLITGIFHVGGLNAIQLSIWQVIQGYISWGRAGPTLWPLGQLLIALWTLGISLFQPFLVPIISTGFLSSWGLLILSICDIFPHYWNPSPASHYMSLTQQNQCWKMTIPCTIFPIWNPM